MSLQRKSEKKKLKDLKKDADADLKKVIRLRFSHYERTHRISRNVIDAIEWIESCRTSRLGGWQHTCECGEIVTMYKSCHNKSCPVCNGYENKKWLEFHRERLVDTKYLHLVFVLPEELNEIFLKNKKEMSKLFFAVVQKILKKRYKGKTGGTIITEHTEGSTLTLHLHLHCLVMLGGYDEETGKFVEIGQSNYKVKKLKEEFEKEYKSGYKKIEKNLNRSIMFDIEKTGKFGVWKAKKYRNSAEAVLGYFSKGVRGGCISNDRILKVTEEVVTFAYKNEQTKGEWAEMELPIDEFIKRVLLHIPAERQKQVRKTGVYASSKRKVLEKCKEAVEGKTIKLQTKKEKKAAEREIGEKVSVICPVCKKVMKVSGIISPVRREKIPA
jgi:diadenosine tetraphosphate (Ap4A) HIT family hydrolase